MTNRRKPALDIAQVRVIGPPETVDRVVDAITAALPATDPSRTSSRYNSAHVRVYLEVSPQ